MWRAFAKKIDDEDRREAVPVDLRAGVAPHAARLLGDHAGHRLGARVVGLCATASTRSSSLLESMYYAGIGFFTVGFGDVVPVASAPRILVLVEAFFGLTTMALLIGFMPTFFAAYSTREELVSTLDDLSGHAGHAARDARGVRARRRPDRAVRDVRSLGDVDGERAREPLELPDADALPVEAVRPVVDRGECDRHRDGRAVRLDLRQTSRLTSAAGSAAAPRRPAARFEEAISRGGRIITHAQPRS